MPPALTSKLAQLDQYLQELQGYLDEPGDPAEGARVRILERMIQLIVECAADAGDLWLGDRGETLGESATGVFRRLGEVGLITAEMQSRLRGYVSARNRIIHDYDRVTPEQVQRDAERLVQDAGELLRLLMAP